MRIVSCTKRNTGDALDRGRGDLTLFEDKQTEEWDIVVDVAGASSAWIIKRAPLPNFNSPHPDNANLRCTGEHQIRRVDGSPIHFQATVTYEGPPAGATELLTGEDPENNKKPEKRDREPYSEEWDTVKSQEPIDVDAFGNAICTVNGEQFDPPIVEDVHDIQIVFGKNVNNKNQALVEAVGKTNSDPFLNFGPEQCVIDSVKYKYFTDPETDEEYWRQTVTVLARTKPPPGFDGALGVGLKTVWNVRVRAEGYIVRKTDRITKVHARKTKALSEAAPQESDGTESPVPVLHVAFGGQSGEQIDDPQKAEWYYFTTKLRTAFQPLKIT